MHQISYDPERVLIVYRIEGFWDMAAINAFRDALRTEVARRQRPGERPRVLADATGFAVQTPAISKAFETFMMAEIVPHLDRIAVVVASTLNKLQVQRVGDVASMRVFLSHDDALAWLTEERG